MPFRFANTSVANSTRRGTGGRWIRDCLLLLAMGVRSGFAQSETIPRPFEALAKQYNGDAHRLVARYCADCHDADQPAGDLDLARFRDLNEVRKDPAVWIKAAEMLDSGEMPPKDSPQPSAEERKRLRTWIGDYLHAEAYANAGDPGPVVLRRLNNAEYTYTVRDLTGIDLDPAKEFPADSAAGEGFTNAGSALVMSPALLTKYLDAAKGIASHAVLLPDGFRFSSGATRSDQTNELVGRIRDFYGEFTDSQGATQVNLQGIVFDTNGGGRIPLDRYLKATLTERAALSAGTKTIQVVAAETGLNAKYLASLWTLMNKEDSSILVAGLRTRWLAAGPQDVPALMDEIVRWQSVLTRFQTVGHMKPWVVPVNPITTRQEIRHKFSIPDDKGDVALVLSARAAGQEGTDTASVTLQAPRLVIPGRPDLRLQDVPAFLKQIESRRTALFEGASESLEAAAEATRSTPGTPLEELATRHKVDRETLAIWFRYLGIGDGSTLKLDYLTDRMDRAGGYEFVQGWGKAETPLVLASSADQEVRIPGKMRGHGVTVHPSPTLAAAVGWKSPTAGTFTVQGRITHVHPECGNGVTWSLELRRGATRQRLAAGVAHGAAEQIAGPIERLSIEKGDLLSVIVSPRDGNHSCDLTDIELTITVTGEQASTWELRRDITPDILAGNPHSDSQGAEAVWHFYTESIASNGTASVIPAGSLLARWQAENDPQKKSVLAGEVEKLLLNGVAGAEPADANLYQQLASLSGPLLANIELVDQRTDQPDNPVVSADWILAPGEAGVRRLNLPADLVQNAEFVTTAALAPNAPPVAGVQLRVSQSDPAPSQGLWPDVPVLVSENSEGQRRFVQAFDDFRKWFPAVACYTKLVPVDEVITLTLFHREDGPLVELMLDERDKARIDRLWEELRFISGDALTSVDAFLQLLEYASQDSDPKLFEPLRKPIYDRAEAYRSGLLAAEPRQLEALSDFAEKVFRRSLTENEQQEILSLYGVLRKESLTHDEAFRLTLARLLVSSRFLYRLESAPEGPQARPVSARELATRLSYFLWSSTPDVELLQAAEAGRLDTPEQIVSQTRRLLADPRGRRLAAEFTCQWLHISDFATLDEKSEKHFPTFGALKGDMQQEAVEFFADLIRGDGSILDLLSADHVIVNEALAKHYGIPGIQGSGWQRVEDARRFGRGGILGLAATLAKQSGASRTSPILRGNWVSEVLLGEKLPDPPADIPLLPEDEASEQLTMRELTLRHTSDVRCSGCHARIDPLGFSLEAFDAIGRLRERDVADHAIDTNARLLDGTEFTGIDGLRDYLVHARRDAFVRQFCKKLLGYALGRGIQLSDEPLLTEMQQKLKQNDYRISVVLEAIVLSRQFREIRGRDYQGLTTTEN